MKAKNCITRWKETSYLRSLMTGCGKTYPSMRAICSCCRPKRRIRPQRGPNTVGLVIEKVRETEEDGFLWYCENCGNKLYEEYKVITDIVKQLPPVMEGFYNDEQKRTCSKCGSVMAPPVRKG